MSQNNVNPILTTKEKTFSSYNQEQGKAYAQARLEYHPTLFQTILDHHASTGGQFDTLIDIGCGPGQAARGLASHFAHAIGLDPSEGMITTARSLGGLTSISEPIRYEVSTAEDLGTSLAQRPIQNNSVDLICAANSAHWFDMPRFWPTAARVLKPGGSVVMWTSGKMGIHPSVPNAAAIEAAMDHIEETNLIPYLTEGNLLTRDRYVDLPLPWTLEPPVPGFDQSTFFRNEWDAAEDFFASMPEVNMDMFEKMLATTSPITRWREAHPDTFGTEQDIVKIYRTTTERLLHEAGVEKGKETLQGAMQGVLLIVKKKSE